MSTSNYSDEFKRASVQQFAVLGYPAQEVLTRLCFSTYSLYKWMKLFDASAQNKPSVYHESDNLRLKNELTWVTQGRDTPKSQQRTSRESPSEVCLYRAHREEFGIWAMCRVFRVQISGF